jgi:4-alpha-glucanotransferase
MLMDEEALRALARAAGIAVEWETYTGEQRVVSEDTLRAVLRALGYACESDAEIAESREQLTTAEGLVGLPPLITALAGRKIRLSADDDSPRRARLLLEGGGARELTPLPALGGIELPAIVEPGYHRLSIGEREIVLAVAPERAVTIGDVAQQRRLWGLAAQVYGLRHHGDGGIGDAAGIAALAETAARHGAAALALSPLHAMFSGQPERHSPYSPSNRLFLNPLYAAPSMVFGEAIVAETLSALGGRYDFAQLEAAPLIDWKVSSAAKLTALRVLFDRFIDAPDAMSALSADFAEFRLQGGESLAQHASFEALQAEQLALGQPPDWHCWPTDLRNPSGPAVAAFRAARQREVLFHMFLQWLADRSLAAAQRRARACGMPVGLIADLAVGMDPAGSHAWSRPQDLLSGLTIGAPPDLFNPNGQQWGITGFSPRALAETGFAPFLATLRAVLRYTGGVRIDHAMGLQRLWVVPAGGPPADGAYLTYPLTDMLRLVALESYRHQAIVIGEDLGTVPAGLRDRLTADGVYGMRVLWFENDGDFIPSEAWDRDVAAMTSTHDLPTLAGWWTGADIRLRAKLGVLERNQHRVKLETERAGERAAIWRAFTTAGIAGGEAPAPDDPQRFVDAAIRFVARAASRLTLLPLEDVLGSPEQPNLPGTIDQHPNWRRRMSPSAGELLDVPSAARRLADVAAERAQLE